MKTADLHRGICKPAVSYVAGAGEHQSGISSRACRMIEAIKQIAITTALALVGFALGAGIVFASLLIGWKGF